jgi:hypothetical protein
VNVVTLVGTSGAAGVTLALGVDETIRDAVPFPNAVIARIVTEYAVPFVRDVITYGDVTWPFGIVVYVLPPSVEYA